MDLLIILNMGCMGSSNVEIKDCQLETGETAEVQSNGIQSVPQIGSIETVIDSSAIDDDLFKISDGKKPKKPLTEEKAREHIKEILGENVPVEFHQTFLKVASGAAHVVGNCKTDGIILSSMGWPGVEYHEAFHRIFELLMPSHERDKIYSKIASRLGLDLYDTNGNEIKESFR